jgi:hypothetical protein
MLTAAKDALARATAPDKSCSENAANSAIAAAGKPSVDG